MNGGMRTKGGERQKNMGRALVCLCLALLIGLFGQPLCRADVSGEGRALAVDPTQSGAGYSAVLYDNPNGLPTSEANAIVETSEGFIWIGSYSGLIRYDGNTFERIDSTTGIASVVSLFVDSRDRLWIGTNDNGVAVMERGEYRMFHKADGLRSSSIHAFAEDAEGNVYIASTQGIAAVDPDMNLTVIDEPRINEEYIRDLRMGVDGVIYGITMNGAVFTMKERKLTGLYDGSDMGITDFLSVLPDPDQPGCAYLGTEQSEVYYVKLEDDFETLRVIDVSPLAYVKSLERIGEKLWICADNGIGAVSKGGAVTKLENIPMNNSIDHLMVDYEGNLWFTSSRQGVMKIVPNQFRDVFEQYGLSATVVNSTCQLDGKIFIGSDTGLIVLDEAGVVESLPLTTAVTAGGDDMGATDLIEMLDGCRIRSIIRDSKGRLWFSTWRRYGLIRYDRGEVLCFTTADGLPSDRVRTVCEGQDGTILAACTGGVARIKGDRVTRLYDEAFGLSNTEILTVAEGANGDIVLGSDGDGIYVIHGEELLHFGTESGLNSEIIMRVKRDGSRNVFWIVTSNSIAYMTEDHQITTIQKFPYSNNFDLYENSQGEMWVLSSNGIYVTSADELMSDGDISPVFYSRDNGLPCIATANSYSDVTDDGELYIAGSTGVAAVNIETSIENVGDVKMAVPYVVADGATIFADGTGTITLPSSVKKLTIYGFVYTYSLMNPQVTYYLDGFDQEKTTAERSELLPVDYTNLKGGDYRFVMELKDSMGHDSKELSVSIVKQKGIREMLWYRIARVILGVAVIAGAVWLHFRRKTRALLKKQQEQNTFIREMTEAFARIIDMKDKYTNGHSMRVAQYTAMLTKELGYDEETVEKYYNIALLHDIGKIGIPPEVLNKQDKLTDEEFRIMQSHTTMGYDALKDISIMPELAIGAGVHHERPDGKGYPKGLTGDEIPRVAQIIAVADTFDAMYSTRPYRKRMNFEKAVSIIKGGAGTQLTSDVVDAFLRLVDKGEFRAPDDHGGGSTEDIDNIIEKTEPALK